MDLRSTQSREPNEDTSLRRQKNAEKVKRWREKQRLDPEKEEEMKKKDRERKKRTREEKRPK